MTKKGGLKSKTEKEGSNSNPLKYVLLGIFASFLIMAFFLILIFSLGFDEALNSNGNLNYEEELNVDFPVLSVNGYPIYNSEILQIYDQLYFEMLDGVEISFETAVEILINEKLLYLEALRMGIGYDNSASDSYVREVLLASSTFSFDDLILELDSQGIFYEDFLRGVSEQLSIQALEDFYLNEVELSYDEKFEFYQENIDLVPEGHSFEDVMDDIDTHLRLEIAEARVRDLLSNLRSNAEIIYFS